MIFSIKFRKLLLPLCFVFWGSLSAQEVIVIDDWNQFGDIPKTWELVGGVTTDWEQDSFLSTNPGTGILVNPPKSKNGPHLISGFEHGDMELELEFMVPKGSNSGIYLQGRYEIQILDSWGKINPNSGDAGGIYQRWDEEKKQGFEGKPPRTNASKAPGLWQKVKIDFEAPRFDAAGKKVKNAKFNQVYLNGVLVHENVEVTGPTRSALFEDEKPLGPLMIQGDHGPVAIRNIKYKPYGDPIPEISDLKFAYHEGKFQSNEEFMANTPNESGQLNKITWDLGHGVLDFAYVYSGNLEIPKSGDYTFSLTAFGKTSLYLDGENVLDDQIQFPNNPPRSSTLPLEKGTIPFQLVFYKNNYPGRSPQLGVYIEGPGIKKSPLHDPNSYKESAIQKPIYLEPLQKPMITRGFFQHKDEKKTHTVAVGEPSGSNFVYDLQQGAILSVWRGGYLDTSPMWRQRGTSQLMLPTGAVVELADGPFLAKLENKNSPWPDSLSSDLIQIQGYTLDRDRRPTFNYALEQIAVEDFFEPERGGKFLTRTIRYTNPQKTPDVWARIIAADKIADLGEGIYLVNEGEYYVKTAAPMLEGSLLRNTAKGQELLFPLNSTEENGQMKYSIIF
ncbi:family 16 glycoside hydrolase [Cyclobacterium roseum]|uniref:family 16 glycoside hydrolase n=1 Tax=Cyclobacterium roseum TaxID=2666137 RepID=UPI00139081EA|nr:family 16 glycoside hydrolase [Cyclobacterium roseum]